MSNLTTNDYKRILHFYKKPIPISKKNLKKQAEQIITNKLCRCIKKVDIKNEKKAIAVCTNTIVTKKGFIRGNFTCKKKRNIQLMKKSRRRK
jgi:hypothetical protein